MITDKFLENIAKLINGESATLVSHGVFSSDVITPSGSDVSFSTELDAVRPVVTKSRSAFTINHSVVRSGTAASSDGDYINSMGLVDSASGGFILADATVPSLLHTSAFDVDVNWKVTVRRV